jgi:putative membrane protein
MKSTSLRLVPLAAAMALSFGVAVAQTSSGTAGPGSSTGSTMTGPRAAPAAQPGTATRNTESRKDDKMARTDRKFIEDAAEGGMMEVQAGQLAASKATDPEVKAFGEMLVKDHTKAHDELVKLANSKKVELPAAPSRGQRKDIEKLGKLSGKEFDKKFAEMGVKDHEKDIKDFEKASGKVKDPELKAWIDKTLPVLKQHLAQAQKLKQGVDASAMGNRGAGPGGTGHANGANKSGT